MPLFLDIKESEGFYDECEGFYDECEEFYD